MTPFVDIVRKTIKRGEHMANNNKKTIILIVGLCVFAIIGTVTCVLIIRQMNSKKALETAKETFNKYNSGELTYDDAKDKLYEVNYYDYDESGKYSTDIEKMKVSKDAYQAAEELFAKEKWRDADEKYAEVTEKDSLYNTAQEKRKQCKDNYTSDLIKKADAFIESGNYEKAIDIYHKESTGANFASIEGKEEETKNAYREYLEQRAERYVSEGKTTGAIDTYKYLAKYFDDDSYNTKAEELTGVAEDQAILEAEEAMHNGEFDKAKSIIESAKKNVGYSDKYEAELERIEEYRPVDVTTAEAMAKDESYGKFKFCEKGQKTNTGEEIDKGIYFRTNLAAHTDKEPVGYVEFYVEDKYDYISGIFANLMDTRDTSKTCVLNIYCDGTLKYTSPEITQGVLPIDFCVDISGAYVVRVEFDVTNEEWDAIDAALINPIMYKDLNKAE